MASNAAVFGIHRASAVARLAAYARVCTTDVDQAAELIGRIFCPHRLDHLTQDRPGFHALHNCAAFDGFSVSYVAYGGTVTIDPGCLERFFLLQVPVRGDAQINIGHRELRCSPGDTASLLSPTLPTRMVWRENCAKLIMLVDRRLIESRAAALAERPVGPVEFEPDIDLRGRLGHALTSQIEYLIELAEGAGPHSSPAAVSIVREAILGLLLTGQRHNLSAAIERTASCCQALPSVFRRARESLEAHADEPLDLERLARDSGIGVRSLQLGFRRHFGAPISGVLMDIRLQRLNERLSSPRGGERVIDIAFGLGFTNLGRMAKAYQSRFGESPSATLRRKR